MCKHGRDQLFAQVAIGRGFDNLCPILLRIGRTALGESGRALL